LLPHFPKVAFILFALSNFLVVPCFWNVYPLWAGKDLKRKWIMMLNIAFLHVFCVIPWCDVYTPKSLNHLLLQEHHSFAHCIAGGCASIATSFVFTPSERIKQQMQIGSHYNNCWYTFESILLA
jgi:hypothetical protein